MWSPTACCGPCGPTTPSPPPPQPPPPLNRGRQRQLRAPFNGYKPHSLPLRDIPITAPPFHVSSKPPPTLGLIQSHSSSGNIDEALALLLRSPTPHPSACGDFLDACISRRALRQGERLHNHVLDVFPQLLRHWDVGPKLVTLYAICGRLDYARRVFDAVASLGGSPGTQRAALTAVSTAYSRSGFHHESLLALRRMVALGILPDNHYFCAALKVCTLLSRRNMGRAIHGMMVKLDFEREPNQAAGNALLEFYLQCGCMDDALQAFGTMLTRDVVSWDLLIYELCRRSRLIDTLEVFRHMQYESNGPVGFTWFTLTNILRICSRLAALRSGKEVHAQMIKARNEPNALVMNALMDMYAKCGEAAVVQQLFDLMPGKNVRCWSVLLNAYSICGSAADVLKTFHNMIDAGIRPDGITFSVVLSSCSRAGFLEEGLVLFDRMSAEFHIPPRVEHYTFLVDLLGRSGMFMEAVEVVNSMPMEPTRSIWGSLLNSSLIHGDVQLGEIAAEKLFQLEPGNPWNYLILSNLYKKVKMWDKANQLRDLMEAKGIKKQVGCSLIHIGSEIRSFYPSKSESLCDSPEFKAVWGDLMEGMKARAYSPSMNVVLDNVDEEAEYDWLCDHSERIALVFGLMNSGHGMPIRIKKTHRVCADCHNVLKVASEMTGRVIVLRIRNRVHYFRDGACSCNDFL